MGSCCHCLCISSAKCSTVSPASFRWVAVPLQLILRRMMNHRTGMRFLVAVLPARNWLRPMRIRLLMKRKRASRDRLFDRLAWAPFRSISNCWLFFTVNFRVLGGAHMLLRRVTGQNPALKGLVHAYGFRSALSEPCSATADLPPLNSSERGEDEKQVWHNTCPSNGRNSVEEVRNFCELPSEAF